MEGGWWNQTKKTKKWFNHFPSTFTSQAPQYAAACCFQRFSGSRHMQCARQVHGRPSSHQSLSMLLTLQRTLCHLFLLLLQLSASFHSLVFSLTDTHDFSLMNILGFLSLEASRRSVPWDLIPQTVSRFHAPPMMQMSLLCLFNDWKLKPQQRGGAPLLRFFSFSLILESHTPTLLSLLCAFQNKSLPQPDNAVSKREQLAAIKLLEIREVFPVIKIKIGTDVQTRESATTGSASLAADCSLDTWRPDWIGQRRRNSRRRKRGGDNNHLLDRRQLSAGCSIFFAVLLFCSLVPAESTRFHCYLSQIGIRDWQLCSASSPLPRLWVIFKGMRGILMRGSLKQTHNFLWMISVFFFLNLIRPLTSHISTNFIGKRVKILPEKSSVSLFFFFDCQTAAHGGTLQS